MVFAGKFPLDVVVLRVRGVRVIEIWNELGSMFVQRESWWTATSATGNLIICLLLGGSPCLK